MATMAEVEGFLTKKFNLKKEDEKKYYGRWPMPNNRSQLVLIDIYDDKLVLSSPFAEVSALPWPAAMKAADEFVFGVVVLGSGHYCLRHVIPLADIDESEVEWGLDVMSWCADHLEKNTVGGDKL
jgi:hypothetical protein